MNQHWEMDSIDFAISQAIISLRYCTPNAAHWKGPAALACANSIEELTSQLENLRVRLNSWAL